MVENCSLCNLFGSHFLQSLYDNLRKRGNMDTLDVPNGFQGTFPKDKLIGVSDELRKQFFFQPKLLLHIFVSITPYIVFTY